MKPDSDTGKAEERKAQRIYVSGQVQGVGYRFFVRHIASQIGIEGYVRNLRDGRVETYAAGTREQLRRLAAELRRGPRFAIVEDITVEDAEPLPELPTGFTIASDD